MHLLVIDDEALICDTIVMALPEDKVTTCLTAEAGVAAFLNETPDVVLCDIQLPDMSGMEVFEKLHRIESKIPIILMTGRGSAGTAIEAMQRGAFEYILKPLDPDILIPLIEGAAETSRMCRTPAVLPGESVDRSMESTTDLLIGSCPAMQEVYRSIGRVARQNVTVLILGESGTGKEVVARALYQYGGRAEGRFLAINCAAIPEQLLESELFGHEKGSFTGAERKKIGKFELCNEGTLFLDEIGDMTPLMQTKVLRVLQDQTFERVGGSETIRTNARIIAATNRNLEQAIEDKEFRSDLFYRLNVYTITLPPLRERGADVSLLANHFLRRFAIELGKDVAGFAPDAMKRLLDYHWPGNVRELQSLIKRALLQTTAPIITTSSLPANLCGLKSGSNQQSTVVESSGDGLDFSHMTLERLNAGSTDIHRELINIAERKILTEVLQYTEGNLTQAAKRLGITRTTLRTKLESLALSVQHSVLLDERMRSGLGNR